MESNKPKGNYQVEMAFTLQDFQEKARMNWNSNCEQSDIWELPWHLQEYGVANTVMVLGVFSCFLVVAGLFCWVFFWAGWYALFLKITKVCNNSACTRQINTVTMDEMSWHMNTCLMLGNRQNSFWKKSFSTIHLLEILLMVAAHEYERPYNI